MEESGLSSAAARAQLGADGPNSLPPARSRHLHQRLLSQLEGPLTLLLLLAATLDLVLWLFEGRGGTPVEPIAIFGVLAINVVLSVLQEYRSERALSVLRALGQAYAWARRDGSLTRVPTSELVRGDSIRVEAGDRVPADAVVRAESALSIDESILTGESLPIEKQPGDPASSGTLVVRGSATLLVTATGPRSTMGRLAEKLAQIETGLTPLERRMAAFGRRIALIAGGVVLALIVLGLASEGWSRAGTVLTFAIAFAVAIVPEGLPAVVTLALAIGVERMARRRAVVRRLAAVEALGSVTIVATDKTGTLTENRLRVAAIFADNEAALIEACVLANDAEIEGDGGDPLDRALLVYAKSRGVDVAKLRRENPRLSDRPFDSAWRYSRVTVNGEGGATSYLKGAFEALSSRSRSDASDLHELAALGEEQASLGRRVIAVARVPGAKEQDLELLGLVAIWDPPRENVERALASILRAGVRVLMVTGDHPVTARAIAEQVGFRGPRVVTGEALRSLSDAERSARLAEVDVVARATSDDKLTIIEALQRNGEVVAMTGDGVNDAPALKRADVGIAMGGRGSDVAREVSDLVLLDDDFATIVQAVDEGRNIYDNIQKFVRFTFATNVALALLVLGGALGSHLFGLRDQSGALILPLTAIQVLFINFIGDGPPALALSLDRSPAAMLRPPRPFKDALLDRPALHFIACAGLLQGGVGLLLLLVLPRYGFEIAAIQTFVFLYESGAKVLSVYAARRLTGRPAANAMLYAATGLGLALTLACVFVPGLRTVLGLVIPSASTLLAVAVCVACTWAATELLVPLSRRAGVHAKAASPLAAARALRRR